MFTSQIKRIRRAHAGDAPALRRQPPNWCSLTVAPAVAEHRSAWRQGEGPVSAPHCADRASLELFCGISVQVHAACEVAVSFQLEGVVGGGRHHLVELLLPALPHQHSRTSGGGLSRPSVAPPVGQAVGGAGRAAGAPGADGQRLHRRAARVGSPSSGCRANSIRSSIFGVTGSITNCPLLPARFRSAIRPAALCAACAGGHRSFGAAASLRPSITS